ncbi:YadA-like family protein [uncultured Megasphaera sp.]|uniref:YadA-like family protein n=1 Tax=uncultured Megasphaera sp. TaxID=165188 RepID=UPI0025968688|nr:YadA-like family protein [uncultured Megasphaera sp.]
MKPLFIHYDGHRTHAYGGMREIKKKNRKWLSLMIALSITLGGMSFYSEVAADGGQQIHGISVNVDPGGEPGNNYNNDGAGYLGVAIGNRASSLAGYGTAIGPYAKADALYSNATGFWAQALGQYSAAYGAGARAINDFGVAFGQGAVVSFGKPLSEAEYNTLPESYKKIFTAVKTEAGTTVYYQTKILLQDGSTQDQSVFSVAIGASAAATDNYAVAIGFKSSADEMGSLSIGAYSEAKGKQGLALGYVAKAIGDFSTAVGQWSQANGDHAVAIGYGAITEKNKAGVAIGYESHSMRIGGKGWNPITDQVWDGSEAQIEALGLKEKVKALDEEIAQKQALEQQAKEELAKFPNDPNLIEKARVAHNEKAKADEKKNKLFATWKTPTGDVAVGNIDTGMTRQITGVAAGSEDTDAVNVAQLKALNRKNVAQFKVLNGKVDTLGTKIEDVKNIADGTKIHYFSVGPDNEKNYSAGENYNNDGVEQHGGIAIGFDASSKDGDGIAVGKSAQARGWESTGIGALTYSVGDFSTSIGTRAQAFGESASAYGSLARAYGANGVAIGTGSLVASKKAITKAAFDALPEEQQALYNIDKVNPKEFYQYREKDKNGDIKDIETNGTAVGNYASSIGIGGVAVGDHAKSSDIDNVNGSNFGVAIGAYSQNKVAQGVALGTLSVADRRGNKLGYLPTQNGSIEYLEDAMEAVGKGKEFTELGNEYAQAQEQMNAAKAASDGDPTNTDLKTRYEQAKQKFDALTNKFAIMTAPWVSRKGAVSIGNDKKGQTRQIIGVAAGSEDTDAVNVAQLKALNRKVDTVDTKIETVRNIADGAKIHYLSVGPDNEKNYSAGENYNNDGVEQHGGIAIGFDASSKDGDGIAVGKSAQARGWESTGIGALTYSVGDFSTSIGTRAQAFGESASAYGSLARAYGANGVAIGTGSLVASKKAITKAAFDALPEEQQALYNIDKVNPKEFYQYREKDKNGDIKDIETNGTAVGNYASSIGIGGVAVGDHAKSSDIDNVNGSNFGVAIGAYSQNKVAQGVALGTLSVADRRGNKLGYLPTQNGSIEYLEDAMEAVGKGKEFTELGNEYAQAQEQMNAAKAASDGDPTNTDLKTRYEQAKQKFDALTNKFAIMTAPWVSRKGAVSIGNDKKGQTRQIIGVAAGSEDTDAVNVAQLKALAMLPMNMYFGGKVENNTYTPGKENWRMPLNEFRMDFGDGLKATQVTDKDGKKYTLVTLDKESLKGDPAFKGDKGESGQAGKDGTNGKSAYDIWLETQTDKTKTAQDFLNSLKGKDGQAGASGATGKSAYQIWKELQKPDGSKPNEHKTEEQFIASLKGEKGESGQAGASGATGKSAYQVWKELQKPDGSKPNEHKTEEQFIASLKGEKGATGQTGASGATGKSAYQVWKELQNPDGSKPNEHKMEQDFFNSLKGKDGKDGKNGVAAAVTVKASEKGNNIQEAKFVITPQKPEMTFVGDRNIKTLIEKDNTVKIALQDTITAKTIKVGDKVTITKEGATFDKVTIAGNQGSITGLTNTTWDTTRIVSGRAATEDQVQQATQTMQRQMVNDMNGIAAGNAALAGLHPLAYDDRDKWNLSAAIGKYRGADAVAFGAFYRPNETTQVSLSGAFGTGRHMLMNAGVAWKVGSGSLPGSSKMAMARQLAAQQWEIEQLRRKDRERDKEMAAMKEREAQLWKEVALLKSKT